MTTPAQHQALAALVDVLDRLDAHRAVEARLLEERAQAIRGAVDAGLTQRQLPELDGRLSAGTVKADLRRLPR